jgi:hypothetical protein
VYKVVNRADNPEPGKPPFEFPSLQIIEYAGDGKWASEEDWWIKAEMKRFNEQYEAAAREHDPDHKTKMTRLDWGDWIEWARPDPEHRVSPSWSGRDDVPRVTNVRDMDFGVRTD